MKLTKLWASALGLLALASCSKDAEPNQPTEQPKTRVVHIDLTAGQEEDGLRVTFGLDGASGKTTGLKMSTKNVILRVAVRRASGEQFIQDLEFTKTPDLNQARYSGQISIPAGGSGDYTIAALLMREAGDGGKVYGKGYFPDGSEEQPAVGHTTSRTPMVTFAATGLISPDASTIEANIPYVTKWQPMSVTANGVVEPLLLELRPLGTLLRMRIKNETASEQTFTSARFSTNAFTPNRTFLFDKPGVGSSVYSQGGTIYQATYTFTPRITVPGKVGSTDSHSPWLYTVVYPRTTDLELTTVGLLRTTTGNFFKAFSTTQLLPHGSVPVTLSYTGEHNANLQESLPDQDGWGAGDPLPKLAIEYVAEYNLDKTKTAFLKSHATDAPNVGLFSLAEVEQLTAPILIDGVSYSPPTRAELLSIFPPLIDPVTGFETGATGVYGTARALEKGVKIGDVTRDYISEYARPASGSGDATILYGLRFKDTRNATAYRYSIITTTGTSRAMLVECIPVGLAPFDIDHIAVPTFWSSRTSQIKSRTFPLYGSLYEDSLPFVVTQTNNEGYYWAVDSRIDVMAGYSAFLTTTRAHISARGAASMSAVRPWIRN